MRRGRGGKEEKREQEGRRRSERGRVRGQRWNGRGEGGGGGKARGGRREDNISFNIIMLIHIYT